VLAAAGIAYPFVMTWIILWVTDKTVGLQVDPEQEQEGLDLAEHGEPAYGELPAAVLARVGLTPNGGHTASGTAEGGAADGSSGAADTEPVA
jgi:hypothetical protein